MGRRIDDYPEVQSVVSNDYVLIDSDSAGTRKIKVINIGGGSEISIQGVTCDVIASPYSSLNSYVAGDVVTNSTDNNLYVANKSTTGAWDRYDWDKITVIGYLQDQDGLIWASLGQTQNTLSSVSSDVDKLILDVSPDFNQSSTYNSGDLVMHDNLLYRCTVNNTSGAWSSVSSNFISTTLAEEIESLATSISNLTGVVNGVDSRLTTAEVSISTLNARKPIIGKDYDTTETYNIGDFAIYNNKFYVCIYDNVTGTWNSSSWLETDIPYQIQEAKAMGGGSHTYSGTSVPDALLGDDNDIYMQYDSNGMTDVYGKINGGWVLFPTNGGGGGGHVIQPLSITERELSSNSISMFNIVPNELGWTCVNETYYFDTTASFSLGDRTYTKDNAKPALGAVIGTPDGANNRSIIMVSTDASATHFRWGTYVNDQDVSFTYQGHTWYYSGGSGSYYGTPASGIEIIPDDTLANSAVYLIQQSGVYFS